MCDLQTALEMLAVAKHSYKQDKPFCFHSW